MQLTQTWLNLLDRILKTSPLCSGNRVEPFICVVSSSVEWVVELKEFWNVSSKVDQQTSEYFFTVTLRRKSIVFIWKCIARLAALAKTSPKQLFINLLSIIRELFSFRDTNYVQLTADFHGKDKKLSRCFFSFSRSLPIACCSRYDGSNKWFQKQYGADFRPLSRFFDTSANPLHAIDRQATYVKYNNRSPAIW